MAVRELASTGSDRVPVSSTEGAQPAPLVAPVIQEGRSATHDRGREVLAEELSEGAGDEYQSSIAHTRRLFVEAELPLGDGRTQLPTRRMQRLAVVVDGGEVWAPHPEGGDRIVTFRPDSERNS